MEYKIGQFVNKPNNEIAKFCKVYKCYLEPIEGGWIITQGKKPISQIEALRQKRASAYTNEADPLKFKYEKALARGDKKVEELKKQWLDKCNEIVDRYKY